jgi:hypothetical protein
MEFSPAPIGVLFLPQGARHLVRGTEHHQPPRSLSHVEILFLGEIATFGSTSSRLVRILRPGPKNVNAT